MFSLFFPIPLHLNDVVLLFESALFYSHPFYPLPFIPTVSRCVSRRQWQWQPVREYNCASESISGAANDVLLSHPPLFRPVSRGVLVQEGSRHSQSPGWNLRGAVSPWPILLRRSLALTPPLAHMDQYCYAIEMTL